LAAALAAVDRARAIEPESEEARLMRAEYLMELRAENATYEPEARELLRGVLAENPSSVRAQFTAAKFHLIDGEFEPAAEALGRVLESSPTSTAYVLHGRAYAQLGFADRAREDFVEALR